MTTPICRSDSNCIRFDWAAKNILRDKADFTILEGLVSAVLGEKITITELLESESNQKTKDDKFNRVDIKAKNRKGEIILIEVQLSTELYFLQRVLFGVAKTITEHLKLGKNYRKVKKVYSINILYFDFGEGKIISTMAATPLSESTPAISSRSPPTSGMASRRCCRRRSSRSITCSALRSTTRKRPRMPVRSGCAT